MYLYASYKMFLYAVFFVFIFLQLEHLPDVLYVLRYFHKNVENKNFKYL